MGRALFESSAPARAVFEEADEVLGFALSRLCFEGPEEELLLTANTQPAILTHSIAALADLRARTPERVEGAGFAAGHSLGEYSACVAAGALIFSDAVRLVRRRGELMLDAGKQRPGAMAAVLGTLSRPIEELCQEASDDAGVVVPANYNCPGQIVISGESAAVDRAMELVKLAGGKAKRLNVSGAFHSPLMEFAVDGLSTALDLAHFADARFPIYANVNAQPVNDAALARRLLLEQLTSPVNWTRSIESIALLYPGALFVEMGPGAVLKGLVKKIVPDATVLGCGTGADVDALLAVVNA